MHYLFFSVSQPKWASCNHIEITANMNLMMEWKSMIKMIKWCVCCWGYDMHIFDRSLWFLCPNKNNDQLMICNARRNTNISKQFTVKLWWAKSTSSSSWVFRCCLLMTIILAIFVFFPLTFLNMRHVIFICHFYVTLVFAAHFLIRSH